MSFLRCFFLSFFLLVPLNVQANSEADFLSFFKGKWQGDGYLSASGVGQGAINCTAKVAFKRIKIDVRAKCGGVARGANLALSLKWSQPNRYYLGELVGGIEKGRARLRGKRVRDGLVMDVYSEDGSRSKLIIEKTLDDRTLMQMLVLHKGRYYKILDLAMARA